MQLDMHYYGTYAMARAAGIDAEHAQVIATAAQFVDDNDKREAKDLDNGARLRLRPTAYGTVDFGNLDRDDQRQIWVPFHFLPGGQGRGYLERLVCRKDSPIAREMVEHHLGLSSRRFARPLIGLTAHVYADTFSHYGFAGISCSFNEVRQSTINLHAGEDIKGYLAERADNFYGKWGKTLSAVFYDGVETISGALGHGAVATYPDRPFLTWDFEYENGTRSERQNSETFLEACRALHAMFLRFAADRPDYSAKDSRPFDAIEPAVHDVLKVEGSKEKRIQAWQDAARSGDIFGTGDEVIPHYNAEQWKDDIENLTDSNSAVESPSFQFYQAAALHRSYVLRMLLPKYDIVVS